MGCVSAKPSPSVIGPVAVPVASRKRRVLGAPPDDIVQRIRQKFAGTLGCGLERGFGWNVLGYEMAEPLQCPDGMSVWVVCIGLCCPSCTRSSRAAVAHLLPILCRASRRS